ncbi:MAG: hypothetical protein HYR56_25460 [Acidobacteria bacterium]|nr:hypothetical protein [Acidobacteriota bacterium]MBI3425405.1 hypothetical protein [Acidobacteriota bacterium]
MRPNVWAIVKREYEALSHVEQYIEDIRWGLNDYKDLISNRVEGYLRRTDQWKNGTIPTSRYEKREFLIKQIFASPMPWGYNQTRAAESVLYTLSRHRPRWLVELCKEAAKNACSQRKNVITYDHISQNLENFSKRRVDDTVAEFKSQCPELEDLLTAFVGQPERFTTSELMSAIGNRVLQAVSPQIAGSFGKPSSREVAQFLFQIGFLTARKDVSDDEYEHISFAENPLLLNAVTNLDQGFIWEIHPVFRQALKLKNVIGKKR